MKNILTWLVIPLFLWVMVASFIICDMEEHFKFWRTETLDLISDMNQSESNQRIEEWERFDRECQLQTRIEELEDQVKRLKKDVRVNGN